MINQKQSFENARNCGFVYAPHTYGPGTVDDKYAKYLVRKCDPSTIAFSFIPDNGGEYAEYVSSGTLSGSSWSESFGIDLPRGQAYDIEFHNTDDVLRNTDISIYFGFKNAYGIYAKLNWISSGRYLNISVDGASYVHDFGSTCSSYGVAGYSGIPSGYYNSPPSPPYQVFPIEDTKFRIPFGRTGTTSYGYLYMNVDPITGALSMIEARNYGGSSDPMYAQSQFQLTPKGIYNKSVGLGPYGPGLSNWLH